MKAEDVTKALECCQSVTPLDCRRCPYKDQTTPEYKSCCNLLIADSLALIREKDAVIERLTRICDSYVLQYGSAVDKEVLLKQERADIVRKMQERLKEHLEKPEFPWDSFNVAEEVIDQIAKEMVDGTRDET